MAPSIARSPVRSVGDCGVAIASVYDCPTTSDDVGLMVTIRVIGSYEMSGVALESRNDWREMLSGKRRRSNARWIEPLAGNGVEPDTSDAMTWMAGPTPFGSSVSGPASHPSTNAPSPAAPTATISSRSKVGAARERLPRSRHSGCDPSGSRPASGEARRPPCPRSASGAVARASPGCRRFSQELTDGLQGDFALKIQVHVLQKR